MAVKDEIERLSGELDVSGSAHQLVHQQSRGSVFNLSDDSETSVICFNVGPCPWAIQSVAVSISAQDDGHRFATSAGAEQSD